MTFPTRSPEMIEQLRCAYALGTMPARLLAIAFAISTTELSVLIRRLGWQTRATGLWAPGKTPSERAAEIRAAEAARAFELYGDAVDDVRLLRQRGFVVVREGQRCRVGNMLCSLAALRAKAARQRRLMEAQRETVGLATGGQPFQSTGSKMDPVERPATLAEASGLSERRQRGGVRRHDDGRAGRHVPADLDAVPAPAPML
jgi:hypothetical protein